MANNAIVIGAGIGGTSAAIRLAQKGYAVTVLEARNQTGGLASGLSLENFSFDAGPYILLDKPGLSWAFEQLGMDINSQLSLLPIPHVYEVLQHKGATIRFDASLQTTAARFEEQYKGSGQAYNDFIHHTSRVYRSLQPLTFKSHPRPLDLLLSGAIIHAPFMLRSLGGVLRRSKLPADIQKAISIWTYVAGQPVDKAPSPMAFVPQLIHQTGAFYIKGGMQAIAKVLTEKALSSGVSLLYGQQVQTVCTNEKKVTGIKMASGKFVPADIVVSNAPGIGTYTNLVENFSQQQKKNLEKLPLQSPGVCIYLLVKGKQEPYYIRFMQGEGEAVAFVQPGIMEPELAQNGWYPARLIAPLGYEEAIAMGEAGQQDFIEKFLRNPWWQQGITDYKVLHCRTTFEWGNEYHLYKNSMNPVMTAAFMRQGRLRHRSTYVKGLYLTGSATHPGQWTSFCAISGVLAADCVAADLH